MYPILPVYGETVYSNRNLNELLSFTNDFQPDAIATIFASPTFGQALGSSSQSSVPHYPLPLAFLEEFKTIHLPRYQHSINELININNRLTVNNVTQTYEQHFFHTLEIMIRYFVIGKPVTDAMLRAIQEKTEWFIYQWQVARDELKEVQRLKLKVNQHFGIIRDQIQMVTEEHFNNLRGGSQMHFNRTDINFFLIYFQNLITLSDDFKSDWMALDEAIETFKSSFVFENSVKGDVAHEVQRHFHD